jgi:hypothetical protein
MRNRVRSEAVRARASVRAYARARVCVRWQAVRRVAGIAAAYFVRHTIQCGRGGY